MSEICKCCGGGDNGEEHLGWCDTPLYDRIADLEQQLSSLRKAALYLWVWHECTEKGFDEWLETKLKEQEGE